MKRILLRVAYDGTDYCGFQEQKSGVPTIEKMLRQGLVELTGEDIVLIGGSRTDAGVHAHDNVAVFDTGSRIPAEKFALALNRHLPEDIRAVSSEETASDFHPRHCTCLKTYCYRIASMRIEDPLLSRYTAWCGFPLDVQMMSDAAQHLVGEHDFKSFCSVYTSALTTVRRIASIRVDSEPFERFGHFTGGMGQDAGASVITITVTGYGFLYNMVRIIAGTLIEVGRGAAAPEDVRRMLEACERRAAGPTAPAKGLTLEKYVFLPEDMGTDT